MRLNFIHTRQDRMVESRLHLRATLAGRWLAQQSQHLRFVFHQQVEHAAETTDIRFDQAHARPQSTIN